LPLTLALALTLPLIPGDGKDIGYDFSQGLQLSTVTKHYLKALVEDGHMFTTPVDGGDDRQATTTEHLVGRRRRE